jgi:hypothetical protein
MEKAMIKESLDKDHNHTDMQFPRTMGLNYEDEPKETNIGWFIYAWLFAVLGSSIIILFWPVPGSLNKQPNPNAIKVAHKACPDMHTPVWDSPTTMQCLKEK